MKKALVLAGGFDQIALINELKKRGYKILLADYLENPPAKDYADTFYQTSTLDVEKIYALAKNENVNLITTACTDQALLTVAEVASRLNLTFYLSVEQARNVTDKYYMKQKFREYGVTTADFYILDQTEHYDISFLNNYPYVIKPCDCNSSKGVRKVDNKKDLIDALNKSFQLSRTHKAVVEEFIDGRELSIDAWIVNGKAEILSITETKKMKQDTSRFTIYQSVYPTEITEENLTQIHDNIDKICNGFQLKEGPLLVQAIVSKSEVYVVEFSARMGGGSKYKLIEEITSIDIMKKYVDFVDGAINKIEGPKKNSNCIEVDYIYAKNGIVKKIDGFEELKRQGLIKEIFTYKEEGSEIQKRETSADRVLGMLLEADSQDNLNKKREKVLSEASILDDFGNDIMYRDCFEA